MTDQAATEIRRRPDGSIDTTYYMTAGRGLQAAAVRSACDQIGADAVGLKRRIAALRDLFELAPSRVARR